MNIGNLLKMACLSARLTAAGCEKKTADEEEAGPAAVEPQPRTAQAPPAATLPPATPAPVTAAATPEPPQLAPPGTFFLLAKTSVETAEGIHGLPPGTELHLVAPGLYEDAEKHRVTLTDSQVTNDLRVAQRSRGADANAQAALMRAAQARALAERARQTQRANEIAANPALAQPSPPAAAATPKPPGGLGTATLNETHSATKGKVYYNAAGTPYWRDAKGRERYDF